MLGYSGSFGRYTWQVDGRHDSNSAYGDVDTGKIGVSARFGAGFSARVLAGTAFRAPTFNDLYFPGFGVPTIGPERSRSMEAGLQWRAGDSSAERDRLPQPRARPDRLRGRPELLSRRPGVRLRLCAQRGKCDAGKASR